MTDQLENARRNIAAARQQIEDQKYEESLNKIPEETEEDCERERERYENKKAVNELVNKIDLPSPRNGFSMHHHRPDPLGPDASAADIANRVRP